MSPHAVVVVTNYNTIGNETRNHERQSESGSKVPELCLYRVVQK